MTVRASRLLDVDLAHLQLDVPPAPSPIPNEQKVLPATPAPRLEAAPADKIDPATHSRSGRLALVKDQRKQIEEITRELDSVGSDVQRKAELFRGLTEIQAEVQHLQQMLSEHFVPQHSPNQLISPQDLLVSRLFNVRNKSTRREVLTQFNLLQGASPAISYSGPELRQPDGFAFMALVNIARDYSVGSAVAFEPSMMCKALFGYYDTRSRQQLKNSIKRLMQAVITFPDFSVQLAQKFTHPNRGNWSVALDPQIVRLFSATDYIWLDLNLRRKLTEGLATWLYGFVRSQRWLEPTRLELLHEESGSEAKTMTAFQRSLYPALRELTDYGVLQSGARIQDGVLHWRRPPSKQGT